MLCPNCDHRLGVIGCESCGWKMGDVSVRNVAVNPLRKDGDYPKKVEFRPARFANRPDVPDTPNKEHQKA